jgi:hypothetical protein
MVKEKKCLICGEVDETKFYTKSKSKCKSCYSNEYKNRPDKKDYIDKQKKWVNNNLIKFRVLSAKHRSIKDGIDFELTDEIILDKLKQQDNKCYISKLPISLDSKNPYSLSLDRLNSEKGYTIENTIIVTKFVNNCKNDLDIDVFIKLIKEVCINL